MRGLLDRLYRLSGALAAFFLCAILVIVMAQVVSNAVDSAISAAVGSPIGLVVPSYADFAGFFLAAATFFALAYTLRHGGHIRVTLVLQALPRRARHAFEVWCVLAAGAISGFFAWHTVKLCLESYRFGDMSVGMVAIPIWIPQAAMAAGLVVLTIALIDELVTVLKGGTPSYEDAAGEVLARDPDHLRRSVREREDEGR